MKYFRCVCGQRFALHQVVLGQHLECPACRALVRIPSGEEVSRFLASRQKVSVGAVHPEVGSKPAVSCHREIAQVSNATHPVPRADGMQALTETVVSGLLKTNPSQGPSHQDQSVEFAAGTLLAQRYRILSHVGRGGMSDVYSANDEQKNLVVAVKVLRRELRQDSNSLKRFVQEASLQGGMFHENIARVYAYVGRGGTPMIVMELLQGDTLRTLMERRLRAGRKFEPPEVLRVMHQLVAATSLIHGRGCIHRDIKPENIWYSIDGAVKLMDFGIARKADDKHLTPVSGVTGSAYYMAPEQLERRGETTQLADQFSLAVVLYEMLSGSIPIGAIKDLSKENARIPKPLASSILKALSPCPEHRFKSVEDFARAAEGLRSMPAATTNRSLMRCAAIAVCVSIFAHVLFVIGCAFVFVSAVAPTSVPPVPDVASPRLNDSPAQFPTAAGMPLSHAMVRLANHTNWNWWYTVVWENEPVENSQLMQIDPGEVHEFVAAYPAEDLAPLLHVFYRQASGGEKDAFYDLRAGVSASYNDIQKMTQYFFVEEDGEVRIK